VSGVLHAACRGVEGCMSAEDAGAASATLIDHYGSRAALLEVT
jgi:hypothetical protein